MLIHLKGGEETFQIPIRTAMLPGFQLRPEKTQVAQAPTSSDLEKRSCMKPVARKRSFAESCAGDDMACKTPDKNRLIHHVANCKVPAQCAICAFLRSQTSWTEATPVEVHGTCVGSWLVLQQHSDTGTLGLCCWVCRKHGSESEFAKGVVATGFLGNLKRHGRSESHQAALAQLGCDNSHNSNAEAPDVSLFEKAWGALGQALTKGLANECGRWKRTQLQWALAEADRQMLRDFLSGAVSIAVAQDGRAGILHMRFSAAHKDLSVRKGYWGSIAVPYGETITNLKKAMIAILNRLCTPCLGGPYEGQPNSSLRQHLQRSVTICVADAAANEQGALRASMEAPWFQKQLCVCRRICICNECVRNESLFQCFDWQSLMLRFFRG